MVVVIVGGGGEVKFRIFMKYIDNRVIFVDFDKQNINEPFIVYS